MAVSVPLPPSAAMDLKLLQKYNLDHLAPILMRYEKSSIAFWVSDATSIASLLQRWDVTASKWSTHGLPLQQTRESLFIQRNKSQPFIKPARFRIVYVHRNVDPADRFLP